MKRRFTAKAFIYFLCISFLLMMNGFHGMIAEAREGSIPIGEMISKGDVAFEARENVWKRVEPSLFPIFQGTKIKTERGNAVVILPSGTQVEVRPNSLFTFEQPESLLLSKGEIEFRIPSGSQVTIKAGTLSILKSWPIQAAKGASAPMKSEETLGSVSIHSNGAVTVKSTRGKLSVLNHDRVVLAALSAKDSVTLPSITASESSGVRVAQVGATVGGGAAGGGAGGGGAFLGISTWAWVGMLAGVAGIAGIGVAASSAAIDHDRAPVCP
jgi:hypothetical protein